MKKKSLGILCVVLVIVLLGTTAFAAGECAFNATFNGASGVRYASAYKYNSKNSTIVYVTGLSVKGYGANVTFSAYGDNGSSTSSPALTSAANTTVYYTNDTRPTYGSAVTLRIFASTNVMGVGGTWTP